MQIGFVTIDCRDPERLIEFWSQALGYDIQRNVYVTVRDPNGRGPSLYFQEVPEERSGKNRVHLDLVTDDHLAEAEALVQLGATKVRDAEENGIRWTVFEDPEGNVFCLFDSGSM
jgi:catechol 2,3-dioxygenase-like lactoylglutathione lyase family enzyme